MKKYRNYILILLLTISFLISVCFIPIDATRFIPQVEKQAKQELGIDVHIDRLIFRFGPSLKIKAPVLHLMYTDGQKFGQLDNVKFFVPWSTLLSENIIVKRIYADKIIVKLNSNDKYLSNFIKNLSSKDYEMLPNLKFKNYSLTYNLVNKNKSYQLKGTNLNLDKIINYKSAKIKAEGVFFINEQNYASYNINIVPNIEIDKKISVNALKLFHFLEQVENLDFHSDIIADLKFYSNNDNKLQISGLINVDNISVQDKEKKNPKSFIYLTFLGDKIGIMSNIYTGTDKKINAEGVINNSVKPEIDLKVKTDKIMLSDVYNKLKMLIDYSKFKDITAIEGELSADFSLKGDLSKIKSSGFLHLSNASIAANGIDVHKIDADIDFSNNIISISKAVGYVKDAPIMLKGRIDKNIDLQLLMDKVALKGLLPTKYGVESGLISLDVALQGTLDNIIHKENIQIQNFKSNINKKSLSFDSLNINTNKNNVAHVSNIAIKPQVTSVIKIPLLKLVIDDEQIKIPSVNAFLPNSKLTITGEFLNYNSNDCTYDVNVSGFVNSKDIEKFANISSVYPVRLNIYGNRDVKNINSQIQILKAGIFNEPSLINLVAKLEHNNLKIEDLSLVSYNGNLLKNLKPNVKQGKKITVNGIIENIFSVPEFKNLRVYIPQLFEINLNNTISQIKCDLFINGKVSMPDIVGQLSAANVINQFIQLSMNNVIIDFNKNVAVVNAPIIKLADSIFGINATLQTNISDGFNIKSISIKSKYLNTDTILMYKDSPILFKMPVKIKDGKLYIERATASMYNGNLFLSALNGDFGLDDNILSIKNISADIYNGKIAGKLDYDLKCDTFKSALQARNVSASPIFELVLPKKDTISGSMDFDASLQGTLLSIMSLNGNVKFVVHNGHMGMLGKLEHLLYAQNVIADSMLRTSLSTVTKAITLKDTGLFKYLRGELVIKDCITNIKSL